MCLKPGADFYCTSFQHRFLEPVHWNTQTRSKNKANCSVALCDLLAMEKLPSSLGSVTDIRNCTQTVLNSCDSFLSLQSLVSMACRTGGVGSQRNQTLRPAEPTVQYVFWRFVTCWQWKTTKQAIRCHKWTLRTDLCWYSKGTSACKTTMLSSVDFQGLIIYDGECTKESELA